MDIIWDFLSKEGFQPHGMCLLWRPDVFWMHVIADLFIALAYFSIPAALFYLASKRPDLIYRWVLMLFGAFIVACGITHIIGIWTMWVPEYSIAAVAKVATAFISVVTAIALWPLMPRLIATPSTNQLEEKNAELASEITDRKAAEAKLSRLNDELEQRVAQRTRSLTRANEELEKARARAEQANEAKSQFLATMSHEIRTPMNGVLGAADVLGLTDLDDEQKEFVEIINESGSSLLDLLNDVLDLSKIEAGHIELEKVDFAISDLLTSTEGLWGHPARDKGLEFSVQRNLTSNGVVTGDRNRIRQILNNLVSNAIKFTERGAIILEIEEITGADDCLDVRFSVRDSGIGITEEQRKRLFKPFSQGDSSTTRKFGGTGLGLVICKNLVELMGGEIGVDSVPGEGSTFWFRIPFDRGVNTGENGTVRIAKSPSLVDLGATDRPLRFLVAEDNQVNQKIITMMLAPLGGRIDIVEDGAKAVAAAAEAQYDVVLMDIQMPNMDGMSAAREIRALGGANATIPIIALTANAMQGDREKYLAAGMNDYVSKPIDRRDLLTAVSRGAATSARISVTDKA